MPGASSVNLHNARLEYETDEAQKDKSILKVNATPVRSNED